MNQKLCFPISTFLVESADFLWQPGNLGEYEQLSLWKLTSTHNLSSDITFQEYQFIPTSLAITPAQESLTLFQWDFPVQAHQMQERELDYLTQNHLSGERDLEYYSKLDPVSVLSNSLKELSDEDFELFLADSLWQDTLSRLSLSRQQSLGQDTRDSDCLSFPTQKSNECSTSRPAGQNKCEKWFKDNGLIAPGYQLSASAMALMMGFPVNWFSPLSQPTPQEESEVDISQEEQLHHHKQPLLFKESSISQKLLGGNNKLLEQKEKYSLENKEISIPCIIKQPKQPEVKGVIKQDLGDRFIVYVSDSDSTVIVSKLLVYPDFGESAGRVDELLQGGLNKCSSKINPPSTKCSSKKRREKGEGSGHVYYRTVTRNGKEYRQAYYQWRENGRQRTKYIPKKLLSRVEEAESSKLPVSDILVLLGGIDKCSSKKSDTYDHNAIAFPEAEVMNTLDKCSSKIAPPSKERRDKGKGSGWIECKPIRRGGKEYQQYWYHYEEWREGDRITKKSRYIPQNLRSRVEKMNDEKVPVEQILRVLRKRKGES